jgi:hypothetical protein
LSISKALTSLESPIIAMKLKQLDAQRFERDLLPKEGSLADIDTLNAEVLRCFGLLDEVTGNSSCALERELSQIRNELLKLSRQSSKIRWRDFVPIQNRLRSISSGRQNGIYFELDGKASANQASVNKLYDECCKIRDIILHSLKDLE